MQTDLFNADQRYPDHPGFRHTDTSRKSAEAIRPKAATVRKQVLECLQKHADGLTSVEIADWLGIAYHTVQPRTAELKHSGHIIDSGFRRLNRATDKYIIVWRAARGLQSHAD